MIAARLRQSRPAVLVVVAGSAVLAAVVVGLVVLPGDDGGDGPAPPSTGTTRRAGPYLVPTTIPADCSRPAENDIMQFLATVPDGSTVRFPPGGCYAQGTRIQVFDRHDLVIDGGGSTFRKTSPSIPNGRGPDVHPNWRLAGGSNITLQNLVIRGVFSTQPNPGNELDHGVSIWGVQTAKVLNATISDVDGDFIDADPDLRTGCDRARCPVSRDITIDKLRGERASRQGVSFTAVDGAVISNSFISPGTITGTGGNGVDLETDVDGTILRNVQVVDNEFGAISFSAVAFVPGSSPEVGNVTVARNRMSVHPKNCAPGMNLGSPKGTKEGVVITGNTILTQHDGIRLEGIGGQVSGNSIVKDGPTTLCQPPVSTSVRRIRSSAAVCGNTTRGFPGDTPDPPCPPAPAPAEAATTPPDAPTTSSSVK